MDQASWDFRAPVILDQIVTTPQNRSRRAKLLRWSRSGRAGGTGWWSLYTRRLFYTDLVMVGAAAIVPRPPSDAGISPSRLRRRSQRTRVCAGAAREGGPYRDQRVGVPEITLIAAAGSQRNAAYPFIMFSTRPSLSWRAKVPCSGKGK